jgi:hypothetical protein
MMTIDVMFRYGSPPGEREMRALSSAWEVYGIRRIRFNEQEHTVRVEYDGTRLTEDTVANLLRNAGMDLREKVALV